MHTTPTPRRRRLGAIFIAGLAAFSLLAAGCGSDETSTGTTSPPDSSAVDTGVLGQENPATGTAVKVGFVTAEGGALINTPEAREAAEAAVDYANEYLAGLNGHEIDLVTCTDKSDGASATACANQFVQEDIAALLIGVVASPDPYFAALEPAGIPIIMQSPSGSKGFTSPVSFGVGGGFVGGMAGLASYANENGYDKLTFLGIDVPTFTAAFDALLVPAFEKAGVEAGAVLIPPGTPDVTSQVTAALGQNPDMVVVVGDPALCKAILPAVESIDTNETPLSFSDACTDPTVLEAVGPEALEGGIVYNAAVSLGDQPEAELYKAVMATYAPGTGLGGKAGFGYSAALSFIRAYNQIKPAGDPDAAAALSSMKTAKAVQLPGFPDGSTFTCDGTAFKVLPAACTPEVLFATMEDGQLVDFRVVDGAQYLNP